MYEIEMGASDADRARGESKVLTAALVQLLEGRDFMGLQLDYAHGNIGKKRFWCRAKKYLAATKPRPDVTVRRELTVLVKHIKVALSAYTLSVLLNCPIEQVEKIMEDQKSRKTG